MRAIATWALVVLVSAGMTPPADAAHAGGQPPPPQTLPTPPPPQVLPTPPRPQPGTPKPAPTPEPPPEREPAGKPVNLLVELTITDRIGNEPPSQKLVSMVAADGTMGRVRANTQTFLAPGGPVPIELNVDARPQLLTDTSLKLQLSLEYTPKEGFKADDKGARPTRLQETLNVILQTGKPLIVSQAADPSSDRRITVEVKATVLK